MGRAVFLLLSALVALAQSAPVDKSREVESSLLRDRCLAVQLYQNKVFKLRKGYDWCRKEADALKYSLGKCKAKIIPTVASTAGQELEPSCFIPEKDCYTGYGHYYRGTLNSTLSGFTCQRWEVQEPQRHTRTPESYPHDDLARNNYCRNPDFGDRPWCYVADMPPSPRWEYCDIPLCPAS